MYDTVAFTDLSTNSPTGWHWLFGDGQDSHIQNPDHSYDTAGTFAVTLTATNEFGSDEVEKKAFITVIDCVGNPNFSANVTCQIGKPLPVLFTGYVKILLTRTIGISGMGIPPMMSRASIMIMGSTR